MPNYPSHILELAKRGAEHLYQELKAEIESLDTLFPHLRGASASRLGSPAGTVKRATRRRKMSAAARKKISEAQKKRWAAKRKAKKA